MSRDELTDSLGSPVGVLAAVDVTGDRLNVWGNAWLEQARTEPRVAPVGIEAPLGALLDEVEQVMLERHAKYGPRNISNSPGGPLNGLRVRLHDKQARVNNYVDNKAPADFDDDSLRDAFVDIVGYGLIGLLVLDGSWPE